MKLAAWIKRLFCRHDEALIGGVPLTFEVYRCIKCGKERVEWLA